MNVANGIRIARRCRRSLCLRGKHRRGQDRGHTDQRTRKQSYCHHETSFASMDYTEVAPFEPPCFAAYRTMLKETMTQAHPRANTCIVSGATAGLGSNAAQVVISLTRDSEGSWPPGVSGLVVISERDAFSAAVRSRDRAEAGQMGQRCLMRHLLLAGTQKGPGIPRAFHFACRSLGAQPLGGRISRNDRRCSLPWPSATGWRRSSRCRRSRSICPACPGLPG